MRTALLDTVTGMVKEEDDKFVQDVLFRRHAEEESPR
jgi:hypothetical protein